MNLRRTLLLAGVIGIATVAAAAPVDPLPATVGFNRDIRPILSDACFQCHGPDADKRKAKLRLDTETGAFAPRDIAPVVRGRPDESEVMLRIRSSDPEEQMPPPEAARRLTSQEIALLQRWIEQGAPWENHWSLIPPARPAVPAVATDGGAAIQPIDAFVRERLRRTGLAPAPEAGRTALIRRVSLDLTGLPPTPAEVTAFVADGSPHAYETVVDRLLASPRYGERMASRWLDAARYADTNGYQSDGERTMWRWRDWVIDAMNRNMPFDQFTIEQLAGDLLPGATLAQKIATGFNRNHRGNGEGGIVPAEYAVEYVVDRVDTTATVWLGLTAGCARCHDHKYDPITQREFYQLFALFNNVPEQGRALKTGNSPPLIKSPTDEQAAALGQIEQRLTRADKRIRELEPAVREAQRGWEEALRSQPPLDWTVDDNLQVRFALDGNLESAVPKVAAARFQDGSNAFANGHCGQAAVFDGQRFIDAGDVAKFGFFDKFTLAAWIQPQGPTGGGAIVSRMVEQDRDSGFASDSEGYSVHLKQGRIQVYLTKRWLDDALRVETEATLAPDQWRHVTVTYDGSRRASGVQVFLDGEPQKLRVLLDELNQTFATREPLRIGAGGGPSNRFRGLIGDVRVYGRVLVADEAAAIATAATVSELATLPPARRTPAQETKLRLAFLEAHGPETIRAAYRDHVARQRERDVYFEKIPTTMVMEEMATPRETYVLKRGEYDKPGERVVPGVPAALAPKGTKRLKTRLDFARWLMSPEHPLTARVAVNHYWQTLFGAGLVRTAEDFGAQGEPPSHPELLDWLATEFVRSGWNVKAMHKLIVMSATYRQSSHLTPDAFALDPENRLLARAPRLRLAPEMVRDQALHVSGLLVEKVGGPSVRPYQPANLWKELSGTDYEQDRGEKLWRRSLYTFWKRTSPPPTMMTFDAAGREACSVRFSRTSTPLQALTLLNDVTFVEAARRLAERILREGGTTADARVAFGFQLVTARAPTPAEHAVLLDSWTAFAARYAADPKAALALVSVGEAPRDEQLPVAELAAATAVANLILNLDEAITRP